MPLLAPSPTTPPVQSGTSYAVLGASGIVLNGDTDVTDVYGAEWGWIGDQGWGPSPARREVVGEFTGDHGDWDSSDLKQARVTPIQGEVLTTTHADLHAARERLEAAVDAPGLFLRIVEPGYDRWARVRPTGELLWNEETPERAIFSLQLRASDPRLYSTALTQFRAPLPPPPSPRLPVRFPFRFSPAVIGREVTNAGRDVAWPKYRLVGPMPRPLITNPDTGESMRFGLSLAANEWLTINTHPRVQQVLLYDDPDLSRARYMRGDFWGLRPGLNRVQFAADGSTALGVDQFFGEVADTWI